MFKPVPLFVGLRYTRAKRRNHFISFISMISMLGIALGVAALITVLSVMNGFEKELRERILGVVSHATVTEQGGNLADWRDLMAQLGSEPSVLGAAPYVSGEAMLYTPDGVTGALLRGIIPDLEPAVSNIHDHMIGGRWDGLRAGRFGIILGKSLARTLGVDVGDKVTVIVPQTLVTPAGILPRLKRFEVVGVFEAGVYQYDSALALLHMEDAATLLQLKDGVSGVRLRLDDLLKARETSRRLTSSLGFRYWVSDWTQSHSNYFRAVQMEKTVMFVILLLIVAVAAFNIVSTLVMMVTDKRADIAILRTLGASPGQVMATFMVQGTLIGMIGTILGVLGGVTLALNAGDLVAGIERLFSVEFLAADVYYITDLPSDLRWPDVGWISVISFFVSVCATLYPAWRAARTQPAEALRYE